MCNTCGGQFQRNSNEKRKLKKTEKRCPKNDENKKDLPQCPSPKRSRAKPKKFLTRIERIMLRIQPPIADRERYLHPEHVHCFLEESQRVYVKKPKCPPCPSIQRKVCVEDQKEQEKKKSSENVGGEKESKNEEVENGEKKVAESGVAKQEADENTQVKEGEEKLKQPKPKRQHKRIRRKKNSERSKHKKNIEEDSDSEMSIYSNNSEVCLAGLALTKEEKKKIEDNRRKVHPPPDNGENSTKSSKNPQDVSIKEEDGDKQ